MPIPRAECCPLLPHWQPLLPTHPSPRYCLPNNLPHFRKAWGSLALSSCWIPRLQSSRGREGVSDSLRRRNQTPGPESQNDSGYKSISITKAGDERLKLCIPRAQSRRRQACTLPCSRLGNLWERPHYILTFPGPYVAPCHLPNKPQAPWPENESSCRPLLSHCLCSPFSEHSVNSFVPLSSW